MTNIEYRKFKAHIFMHLDADELADILYGYLHKDENRTLWGGVEMMCKEGYFNKTYGQVLDTLKYIYGDKYDESKYLTENGGIRVKNGVAYCWIVYKAKIAKTIEIMIKKGDI